MKRAEKAVIRAGLESYLAAEEQRDIRALAQMRQMARHHRRVGIGRGAHDYYELARAQIIILRRTRHCLEAIRTVDQMRAGLIDADYAPLVGLHVDIGEETLT